ncbi:MAG: ATP-binding cassette domain-containing protein [Magnetococcales bacterium]|nr:ATP-binding cassette domain-containing protein [Magnetococcales bacterium]
MASPSPATCYQTQSTECGLAAMAMILAHHGRHVTLEALRRISGVDRDCTNAADLLRVAQHYGLNARVLRREPETLESLGLPLLVHMNFIHFVVVEQINDAGVWLNDPACGRYCMPLERFNEGFTGIALVFEPGDTFQPGGRPVSRWMRIRRTLADTPSTPLALAALSEGMKSVPLLVSALLLGELGERWLTGTSTTTLWEPFSPSQLLTLTVVMVLLYGVLSMTGRVLFARLAFENRRRTLPGLVRHMLTLPESFFHYRIPSILHSRVYAQETIAHTLFQELLPALFNTVGILLPMVLLLVLHPMTGAVALIGMVVILILLKRLDRIGGEKHRPTLQHDDLLWSKMAFAMENFEFFKTGNGTTEFFIGTMGAFANGLKGRQSAGIYRSGAQLLPALLPILGGWAILMIAQAGLSDGRPSIGTLLSMLCLIGTLHAPIQRLAGLYGLMDRLDRMLPPLEDLWDQIPEPDTTRNPPRPLEDASQPILSASGLRFGFTPAKPPLLSDISLTIRPGEQIGLTGPSGGGKSTLARMLVGLHQPWHGQVQFRGRPLTEMSRAQRNREIGWVDKQPLFLPGSVRINLLLWREDLTEADLARAIRDACLDDTIAALPQGLDTPVAPHGANFSGGQRQRLEIARVLLGKPEILVLDEATDGLDQPLEQRLRNNLKQHGITLIMVSHRESTLAACDRIVHLVAGRLVHEPENATPITPQSPSTQEHTPFGSEEPPPKPSPPPKDQTEALLSAFRLVAKSIGATDIQELPTPLPNSGEDAHERGLYALALHNRIPIRPVRFQVGRWWRRDHGPLLAFTRAEDGHRPVAIVPNLTGDYVIVDPRTGSRTRLDASHPPALSDRLYTLHPRCDTNRPRSPWTFLLHAPTRILRETLSALMTTLMVAIAWCTLPLAGTVLFTTILPFADDSYRYLLPGGVVVMLMMLGTGEWLRLVSLHRLHGRLESSATSAILHHVMRIQPLTLSDLGPQQVTRSFHAIRQLFEQLRHGTFRHLLDGVVGVSVLTMIALVSPESAGVALGWVLPLILLPVLLSRWHESRMPDLLNQRLDAVYFLYHLLKGAPRLRQMDRAHTALDAWQRKQTSILKLEHRLQHMDRLTDAFIDLYPWLALGGFSVTLATLFPELEPTHRLFGIVGFWSALFPFKGLARGLHDLGRCAPILQRLTPLVEAPTEPLPKTQPPPPPDPPPLELHDLSFTYPGHSRPALDDLSLRLEPGRIITLTGPSGSGKSTLLRLLLGFYQPDGGEILRDGLDHSSCDLAAWRETVGAVLQDDRLDHTQSIRGHIGGHSAHSLARIRNAARLAMLEQDIDAMPMGIQTLLDTERVSTGQKQRLLIARRLLRKPKLLILDEATNALPEAMQADLFANLRNLGIACIVVSHRASAIAEADQVFAMEAGRIVWSGTPAEFTAGSRMETTP